MQLGLVSAPKSILSIFLLHRFDYNIVFTTVPGFAKIGIHNSTTATISSSMLNFLKDFIYLFLERGERKEKERERNINVWLPLMRPLPGTWPATQACALTGNPTGDPFGSQAGTQPTEHTS